MAPSTVPTTTFSAAMTSVKPITWAKDSTLFSEKSFWPVTSAASLLIESKMPVEASTVQMSTTATKMTTPIAEEIRKENFTADQKVMYTTLMRTFFAGIGFKDLSDSFSATLLADEVVPDGRLYVLTEVI